MNASPAIFYLLSQSSTLAAIVGDKIYPFIGDQGSVAPYIVFSHISSSPTNVFHETSVMDRVRTQIDIYAKTHTECLEINIIIRGILDRVASGIYNGLRVDSIIWDGERDGEYDQDARIYNYQVDYLINAYYNH